MQNKSEHERLSLFLQIDFAEFEYYRIMHKKPVVKFLGICLLLSPQSLRVHFFGSSEQLDKSMLRNSRLQCFHDINRNQFQIDRLISYLKIITVYLFNKFFPYILFFILKSFNNYLEFFSAKCVQYNSVMKTKFTCTKCYVLCITIFKDA